MQERFAAVRATITEYMLPVAIPKNTSSTYGDLDESDSGPSSPKKTDATELKMDKSLQKFIEALPFLEPLHYGFKLQGPNQSASCICSSARGRNPCRRNHGIVADYILCGIKSFQAHCLIQHCESKGDDYHKATAFYLRTLFGASRKIMQCQLIEESNMLLSIMRKVLMINQERQLMQTNKFLFVIITLLTVKNQTMSTK
jgi:hypothetical protein